MFFSMARNREKKRAASEPGTPIRRTFKWAVDENGKKVLKESERINRQEEIDSYKDECDIQNIVKRAAFDPSLWDEYRFELGDGRTIDVTGMPGTLAEAQQLMIDIKQDWDKMPNEVKQKFDNDVDMFIHSFGSQEWANALGLTRERAEAKQQTMEEGKAVNNEQE